MSDLEKLKRRLLADPDVKAEYEAQAPDMESPGPKRGRRLAIV